jgi:hypothetical protein
MAVCTHTYSVVIVSPAVSLMLSVWQYHESVTEGVEGETSSKDHLEILGVYERVILNGSCKHGKEALGLIKCGEFHYWLTNC